MSKTYEYLFKLKKIPKPSSIIIDSKETKKLVKKTIRSLLNEKKAQPVGITYCSHFLNFEKIIKEFVSEKSSCDSRYGEM